MKIAIFGCRGLLGQALTKCYKKDHELKLFSRTAKNGEDKLIIDYKNINKELDKHFENWNPDIIINTIAIVNLEYCENNYEESLFVNVQIAEELAVVSKKYNSYFIHISTDHFFYDKLNYHTEEDEVKLLNNYAITKFKAEKSVRKYYENSLIVRTNILGFRYKNNKTFFEWLLDSLENKEQIILFKDYVTSPISVINLSEILLLCKKNNLFGIYNIASRERIDKYSFGFKISQKFKLPFKNVKLGKTMQNDIKRATTLGLDVSKIENALNIKMPTIDQTIDSLYNEYKKERE